MILGHKLELQRSLMIAGDDFEHGLVGVGNDDGPEQPGVRGLVQGPIQHRLEPDRKYLFGQPASDRVQASAQPSARNHRRVQHHERIGVTGGGGNGGRTRVSCTLTFGEGSSVSEASPGRKGEQGRRRWTPADVVSFLRIPLAIAFVLVPDTTARLVILVGSALTDLLDGPLARRFGSSALGPVVDPIADKLFMACAFGVVAFSGKLELYEILAVLLRDIVAAVAFVTTLVSHHPRAIPARPGGKAVTVAQMMTLVAFLFDSPLLRPMAWATGAIAIYAIWDYYRVAPYAGRRVGQ